MLHSSDKTKERYAVWGSHGDTNVPEDQVNVRRVELHKTPAMTVTDMRAAIKVQTRKPQESMDRPDGSA